MDIDAQIKEYADKLSSPDISARVKKRILQKLGKLKKLKAEGKSLPANDVSNDLQEDEAVDNEASLPPTKKAKVVVGEQPEQPARDEQDKTAVSKKEKKNLLHLLNKDLASFAVKKQADKAKLAVKQLMKKGVKLDTLAYTNLINVYVRCNEISRVVSVVKEMKEECVPLNIVTYTTVLKGYSEGGMVKEANILFDEMVASSQFNARSITTYLRGCIRTGMVKNAITAYQKLKELRDTGKDDDNVDEEDEVEDVEVTQETSCLEYAIKLLCQAGRATEAATLIKSHIDFMAQSGHSVTETSAISNAGLYTMLARACVLFGQWSDASKYSKLALDLLEIEDKANLTQSMKRKFAETFYQEDADAVQDLQYNPSADGLNNKSLRLFRQHRRAELRNGLEMLEDYLSAVPEADRLSSHVLTDLIREVIPVAHRTAIVAIAAYHVLLSKLFNFGFDGVGDIGKTVSPTDVDALVMNLLQGHKTKFGMVAPQVKQIVNRLLENIQARTDTLDDGDDEEDDDSDEDDEEEDGDGQGFLASQINNRVIKIFLKKLEDSFISRVYRSLSPSANNAASVAGAGMLNFRCLFYQDEDIEEMIKAGVREEIPIKLEIGSGNGDWIVAQAEADRVIERSSSNTHQHMTYTQRQQMFRHKKQEAGQQALSGASAATNASSLRVAGHWVALELRCDRVYNILANHLVTMRPLNYLAQHHADLQDLYYASNLAVLGGDAVQIVNQRIPRQSVSEIYINYPQPPERVTGSGKTGHKNQGKHLLTKEFFYQLLQILKDQGTITLLTDNLSYAQNLAQSLVELAENSGTKKALLLDAMDATTGEALNDGLWKIQETFPMRLKKDGEDVSQEITVWRGEPGKHAGHVTTASSYFDRMWAMGQKKRRWFLFLRKQVPQARTPKTATTTTTATSGKDDVASTKKSAAHLDAEGEDEFMVDDRDEADDV